MAGASVQVNVRGGAAATVYVAETGAPTLTNPLSTDTAGRVEGWLEEGSYDLVVSGTGFSTYTERFEAIAGTYGGRVTAVESASAQALSTFNVKNAVYGAVGNGVANDSPAVQAAVNAAIAAAGGIVYFPPGTYKLDATISFAADNIHILGAGRAATKIVCPAAAMGFDIGDGTTQYHYLSFSKMMLSRLTAGGATTVRMRKPDQFRFDDCDVAAGTNGIELSAPIAGVISGCGINLNTAYALSISGGADQVAIIGNTFETTTAAGRVHIVIGSGANKNIAITGNVFSSANKAIVCENGQSSEVVISGNMVNNCTHGFDLGPAPTGLAQSSITGNTLRGIATAGSVGIRLHGPNNTVVGNTVTNYTSDIDESGTGALANVVACNRIGSIFVPVGATTSGFMNERGEGILRVAEGTDLRFGDATGSTIADGATQKIAFWGAAPIVKPAAPPANATDLATAITLVNDLKAKLVSVGLR